MVGLYTPTILGGNSHLSWFYDRRAIKDPTHTGTSKGLSQAINRGPIRLFLPKYANVYVTIQSHALSAGARTHYVTANGVRNGLLKWGVGTSRVGERNLDPAPNCPHDQWSVWGGTAHHRLCNSQRPGITPIPATKGTPTDKETSSLILY